MAFIRKRKKHNSFGLEVLENSMHYCRRDSHATSRTPIYANIKQTGRIRVYCSWFWVVLVGFVGFVGGFGWFWVVLLVVLGGFGWFWVVLGGFGWFRVLVTTVNLPSNRVNLSRVNFQYAN